MSDLQRPSSGTQDSQPDWPLQSNVVLIIYTCCLLSFIYPDYFFQFQQIGQRFHCIESIMKNSVLQTFLNVLPNFPLKAQVYVLSLMIEANYYLRKTDPSFLDLFKGVVSQALFDCLKTILQNCASATTSEALFQPQIDESFLLDRLRSDRPPTLTVEDVTVTCLQALDILSPYIHQEKEVIPALLNVLLTALSAGSPLIVTQSLKLIYHLTFNHLDYLYGLDLSDSIEALTPHLASQPESPIHTHTDQHDRLIQDALAVLLVFFHISKPTLVFFFLYFYFYYYFKNVSLSLSLSLSSLPYHLVSRMNSPVLYRTLHPNFLSFPMTPHQRQSITLLHMRLSYSPFYQSQPIIFQCWFPTTSLRFSSISSEHSTLPSNFVSRSSIYLKSFSSLEIHLLFN